MLKYICLFFLILSCNEKMKPNFSKDQMLSMARKGDPTMTIKVGSIDKALVDCHDYKFKCRIGFLVVIKGLEMKALYYESQKDSIQSSKRLKAYRARNWVFEDVAGEPILERFVVEHLKAHKEF